MQEYFTDANASIAAKRGRACVKILVTGAGGFIGSRLVAKLLSLSLILPRDKNFEVLCLTRNKESLKNRYDEDILRIIEADVNDYSQLVEKYCVRMRSGTIHMYGVW
jgi:nucleoside-diphosphate-sugar epimerase